jgi:chromosome partition protein MukE
MTDSILQNAIQDPLFARVDVALRRGRHISADEDVDEHLFLERFQKPLVAYYDTYDAELYQDPDGFWVLIPRSSSPLRTRDLSRTEMVLGLALAHLRLDPAILRAEMTVTREQLYAHIEALFGGEERLQALLRGGSRGKTRIGIRLREEFDKKLTTLAQLGFISVAAHDRILLRPALARFCGIGRDAERAVALERLVERCHAVLGTAAPPATNVRSATDGTDDDEETIA